MLLHTERAASGFNAGSGFFVTTLWKFLNITSIFYLPSGCQILLIVLQL